MDASQGLAADVQLALRIADSTDELTLQRFRAADLRIETKPDATPVTDADRGAESLVRERLATARPADAVLGEEQGETGAGAQRRWIVDPIDGTKNFARGVPVWATLLALEVAGEVVAGVVSAPALGRRWWASAGGGAWAREFGSPPRRLHVSGVTQLADASFSYSSLAGWHARGTLSGLLGLCERVWRTRAYGDFWSYMLVAEGVVDIAAEPEVSRWDLAALDVVVREAGGRFTALDGTPGSGGGSALATNGLLHEQARTLLA